MSRPTAALGRRLEVMSRHRLFLAATLVVFVAGMVASASASAAGQWYISGSAFSGTESVAIKADGSSTISTTITGTKTTLTCTSATDTGTITGGSKDTAEALKFSGCTISEPAGCKVASSLTTAKLTSELVEEGGQIYDQVQPSSGTTVLTLTITECALEGAYRLTGSVRCLASEVEEVAAACEFSSSSGSKLKAGSSEATFVSTTETTLTGANAGKQFGPVRVIVGAPLVFKKMKVGESEELEVTLTPKIEVTFGAITAEPAVFKVKKDTCSGKTIVPPAKCTFNVLYTPAAAGEKVKGWVKIPGEETKAPKNKVEEWKRLEGES
jgi:hypothetical protein